MTARKPTQTIVVDFRIPFWRMVAIMVKLSIASIPAAIILTAIFILVHLLISSLFAGVMVLG
ncbi:MAG: hypothetical protein GY747_04420 [Planctomycetes bacterium]|nr:hypothetical protein [Planctomycetota bacterium]MCP4771497.1 hypothetical protein [Planctomycetota bacterium]MCP4861158.1 hypothetical protein [Planctomycetota bacterium]